MRCGWGFYFRGAFEAQAGNSPLQGQSKPPAKLVVLIVDGEGDGEGDGAGEGEGEEDGEGEGDGEEDGCGDKQNGECDCGSPGVRDNRQKERKENKWILR